MDMQAPHSNSKRTLDQATLARLAAGRAKAKLGKRRSKEDRAVIVDGEGNPLRTKEMSLIQSKGGRRYAFVMTTQRNDAGAFVGWRELRAKNGKTRKVDFFSRQQKQMVEARIDVLTERWIADGATPAVDL